ncbi:15257_t:CDS:2 [Acaulospora colombiana]|uniref:15257_t:CDS:1 n=1 Tax=Acaulospora colombiana TaxID=27376 RepID=A0ACA9JY44_9GLOM|nr:15257_t:CDS:2 [Acaulospora colombiana]
MSGRGGRGASAGHLARDCPQSSALCRECTESPKEKKCYNCGLSGHLVCQIREGVLSSSDLKKYMPICFYSRVAIVVRERQPNVTSAERCVTRGHIARNCDYSDTYDDYRSDHRGTRGSNSECYKMGHIARNCRNGYDDYNSGKSCYNCGVTAQRPQRNATTVVSSDTTAEVVIKRRAPKSVIIEGHIRRDCPEVGA